MTTAPASGPQHQHGTMYPCPRHHVEGCDPRPNAPTPPPAPPVTVDGAPITVGMHVTVCHVPSHDYDHGLHRSAVVEVIAPNGIILNDRSRVGAPSLFSSPDALAQHVAAVEALAAVDDQLMRYAQ